MQCFWKNHQNPSRHIVNKLLSITKGVVLPEKVAYRKIGQHTMVLKKHQAHFSKIKDIFVYKESNLSGFVLISPAEKSSHTGGHGLP